MSISGVSLIPIPNFWWQGVERFVVFVFFNSLKLVHSLRKMLILTTKIGKLDTENSLSNEKKSTIFDIIWPKKACGFAPCPPSPPPPRPPQLHHPVSETERLEKITWSQTFKETQSTIMVLSFWTDMSGQTVQTQIRSSLISVYTVCHSICII